MILNFESTSNAQKINVKFYLFEIFSCEFPKGPTALKILFILTAYGVKCNYAGLLHRNNAKLIAERLGIFLGETGQFTLSERPSSFIKKLEVVERVALNRGPWTICKGDLSGTTESLFKQSNCRVISVNIFNFRDRHFLTNC